MPREDWLEAAQAGIQARKRSGQEGLCTCESRKRPAGLLRTMASTLRVSASLWIACTRCKSASGTATTSQLAWRAFYDL